MWKIHRKENNVLDKQTMEQLAMMDADRERMVERLKAAQNEYTRRELGISIKAHDDQVKKLIGLDIEKGK